MKLIVIGAVAAGTAAAAKARRNDDNADITIYEQDQDISYSSCGLPYYIGGEVEQIDELTPRDAHFFKKKYNINVCTGHQVQQINYRVKTITVKNLATEEVFDDSFDKLVIATGASPVFPKIRGIDQKHVFGLRTVEHARQIKNYLQQQQPKTAVIVGTGFIGFEMLENLHELGIDVTIVEKNSQITPNLDEDMAQYLETQLRAKGIKIIKQAELEEINSDHVVLSQHGKLSAELVIMATGIKPNVQLAERAGVELGETGAIKVNKRMQTNMEGIYACGDCIETFSLITMQPVYHPLGSTANKTGRIAGDVLSGGSLFYKGNLATGIYRLFNLTVATTGLSENEAKESGINVVAAHNSKPDKASYFNGKEMCIKSVADKQSGRLLGVQIIGEAGVDKRIDVFATLITYGASADELFHLDLAYAPPFSTTKDPVHYTGMILDNAISKERDVRTSSSLDNPDETIQIIDTRTKQQYNEGHVKESINIPHAEIRERMGELDKEVPVLTYCNGGTTGNAVQNILINHGFKNVSNLSGGYKFYRTTLAE
ncbi:NADPH-dependent 2,4-dienoyl-CoA reductase, sulfur reductase [Amphibacillus marinus]|uniref:NADPH-dependent 2,4-dienoyl-CoA reductase, sulfur reductase n=1 Tax=Amphibacillus marinus TaxID=872970 RepID=A0A1H8TYM3_9BACI|nr:FAD-dependent oxidoreductase [Amphibacillus marinus]SEO96011.1 NADPH-dependent 2,4-dienoyl-CoA reductase, sulfur reductase [Amphibacillus marinus]